MNDKLARYWRRFLDGKELVPYDEALLLAAIEEEPGLVSALAEERGVDAMLRMSARAQHTAEEFVRQVTRCATAEAELAVAAGEALDAESTELEAPAPENRPLPPVRLEHKPVAPAPSPPSDPSPLAADEAQLLPQRTRTKKAAEVVTSERRIRGVACALSGTAALLAALLLGIWLGRGALAPSERPEARRPEPPVAERGEKLPPRPAELPQPKLVAKPAEEAEASAPRFAEWSRPQFIQAVWTKGGPKNNRLPQGLHELASGRSKVAWNDATSLEIAGPARLELRDDGTLMVWRGTVRASDSRDTVEGTCLMTPVARVAAHAAAFEVAVQENGNTEFAVVEGALRLVAGGENPSAAPLRLAAGEFDEAKIERAPEAKNETLVFTKLSGSDERFRGVIQLDGAALQFASPAAFDDFRGQVLRSLASEPQKLLANWPNLVSSLQGVGGAALNVERGGQQAELRSLDELFQSLPALPAAGGLFSGSITIDGQEMKFNSPAEFEAARKKLFSPFDLLPPPKQ